MVQFLNYIQDRRIKANPLKNGDAKLKGLTDLPKRKCYCQPVAEYDGGLRLLAFAFGWSFCFFKIFKF